MNQLDKKYQKYLELLPQVQDKYGFIESHECDALLWTGLVGCLPGLAINIDAAFNSKDKTWHRRPINHPCYPCHSKSTISRDMFLGLAWYCYANKRTDIADQIVKYTLKHFGCMGKGKGLEGLSRINIMPPLFVTFLLMSKWGKYFKWLDLLIPANMMASKKQKGFRAHLQVMHCLLRNKLTGTNKYKNIFKYHAEKQPNNALFQYLVRNRSRAEKILNDPILFPPNRLPTNHDRKACWLWQRDYGKDWCPNYNDKKKAHSGGDFLFLYDLMKGKF